MSLFSLPVRHCSVECLAVACFCLIACRQNESGDAVADVSLFRSVPAELSGLDFVNRLEIDSTFNVFAYRNYYNGGGVAIGDVTGDGLEDIYLTSNLEGNRLYRNDGGLRFTDITAEAGVGGTRAWSTGVAMADVNGDGYLDIYVCNSGDVKGDSKANELFINDGAGHFSDRAAEYGLDDEGFTTHATFFDYDHDGDLDCYVLNNSFRPISTLGLRNLRDQRDARGGDKLYRNDGQQFADISEEAGIFGSVIGFGLGVSVGDVNEDGWEDIYVSNDFYERDYLYINNREGGFTEELTYRMQSISNFSMGADISDLNNDGAPEIFVTDMLPDSRGRLNRTTRFGTADEYALKLARGFHHQVMRNTLQLNGGNGTFTEVGQLLGVAATDWSWGALIADFDNNGRKDIFVANGVARDVTDQDFISFLAADEQVSAAQRGEAIDLGDYVSLMPISKVPNRVFAQAADMQFGDSTQVWGFGRPTQSNGSAYADLDHDGDLDLVVNNLDTLVSLYENRADTRMPPSHAVRLQLTGDGRNPFSVGTQVSLYRGTEVISYEHLPVRGFQSSMTYHPLIGLGESRYIDSLVARDVYGRVIRLSSIELPPQLHLDFRGLASDGAERIYRPRAAPRAPFRDATNRIFDEPIYHLANRYSDFDRERLLYFMNSSDGPALAIGRDSGPDAGLVFLGGSAGTPAQLLQFDTATGRYHPRPIAAFERDAGYEDVAAAFADLDGDGFDEIVVGSGGSEFVGNERAYPLRIYQRVPARDGGLRFERSRRIRLPPFNRPVTALVAADFDGDGDIDLATAGRLNLQGYGLPAPLAVYVNQGRGQFTLPQPGPTSRRAAAGMINDLTVGDLDGDGLLELVAVGEFGPVLIYRSIAGIFDTRDSITGSEGLYRSVALADLDGDDRPEILVGGYGGNTLFTTRGSEEALALYFGDFDGNGTPEPIFARRDGDAEYPLALKSELQASIPSIKKRFVKHVDYADQPLSAVFDPKVLAKAYVQRANSSLSQVFRYDTTTGEYSGTDLPWQAQTSVTMSILPVDVDGDGDLDVLLAGNFFATQPRVGPLDASRGTVLLNDSGRLTSERSLGGLGLGGQVRHLQLLPTPARAPVVVVARNNGRLQAIAFGPATPDG